MRGSQIGRRDFITLGFARDALRARAVEPNGGAPAGRMPWRMPDVALYTQDGKCVRLTEDLLRDRVVVIHLLYAGWAGHARLMRNLERVHDLLRDRFGRDAWLLSLCIDRNVDSSEKLAAYAGPGAERDGWLTLTGDGQAIDAVRRALGACDPDPALDADRSRFAGVLTLGSDRTGRWASLPALLDPVDIVARIRRLDAS